MMTWVLLPGPAQEEWQEYSVLLGLSVGPHCCSTTMVEAPHPELSWREEAGQGREGRRERAEWGEMV